MYHEYTTKQGMQESAVCTECGMGERRTSRTRRTGGGMEAGGWGGWGRGGGAGVSTHSLNHRAPGISYLKFSHCTNLSIGNKDAAGRTGLGRHTHTPTHTLNHCVMKGSSWRENRRCCSWGSLSRISSFHGYSTRFFHQVGNLVYLWKWKKKAVQAKSKVRRSKIISLNYRAEM